MEINSSACERLHLITKIPIVLTNENGSVCGIWPDFPDDYITGGALEWVLTDFRLQKKDAMHPLITFFQPGYFLGVCALPENQYAITGLVGQFPHTRQEILDMCQQIIQPNCLQRFVDLMLKTPLFSLEQMENIMCLLIELTHGVSISPENIQLNDIFLNDKSDPRGRLSELFTQREGGEFHVPIDFESALCHAIESGSRAELMNILYSPVKGRVGKMSLNELRQQKYSAVCLATILSRAAIRAGLSEEESFGISDSFCQHIDRLDDISMIQRRVFTMMTDYCDRVRDINAQNQHSQMIRKCVDYISVHLHEPISLEDLSRYCGLCGRSLSIRFKKEMGMGIPDYIHQEKIKEAKYMLKHTAYSLSEITCFLNYPSQSYFTKIFKKHCGITPQQYRDNS